MTRAIRCLSIAFALGGFFSTARAEQEAFRERLRPVVEQILDAFDEKHCICLGERHGNVADSELRIALVSHPEFAKKVHFIVVEFANGAHQETIDRYVAGEDVSIEELRRVWRDTGYRAWDSPIYEAFFTAVRETNLRLEAEDRVRVLAGDVPVDWSRISNLDEYLEQMAPHMAGPFIDRGSYPAKVIGPEVLAKGSKVLAVYGAGHCERGGAGFVHELEKEYPGQVMAIAPVDAGAKREKLKTMLDLGDSPALIGTDDKRIAPLLGSEFLSISSLSDRRTIGHAMDALVYFGAIPDRIARPDPEEAAPSPAESAERRRRAEITRQWRQWVDEQLRKRRR